MIEFSFLAYLAHAARFLMLLPDSTILTEQGGPPVFCNSSISAEPIANYASVYKNSVQSSVLFLRANSVKRFSADPALTRVLSQTNVIYDLQEHALPRPLKRQQFTEGVEITVHHSSAKIVSELGRGSFGVVGLLKSGDSEKIAIKSQAPIDCLALEYELLQTAKKRFGTTPMFFPNPLSFVFFADGALLAMSAVSESGLNLIDLVNAYTLRDESVPEIVVLYYTSRMLSHIEALHWKAKVLVRQMSRLILCIVISHLNTSFFPFSAL